MLKSKFVGSSTDYPQYSIVRNVFHLLVILVVFSSCKSTPKKITSADRSVSRQELKQVTQQFVGVIADYFKKQPNPKGVFVALLPTKNDTTQNLPVDVLDFSLVNQLLKERIYTVRSEDRTKALEEIELKLTGLSDSDLSVGEMKSPNYFIKMKIKENYVRQSGDRYIEYTIVMEMRSVQTQVVVSSDSYEFTKKIKKIDREVSW